MRTIDTRMPKLRFLRPGDVDYDVHQKEAHGSRPALFAPTIASPLRTPNIVYAPNYSIVSRDCRNPK